MRRKVIAIAVVVVVVGALFGILYRPYPSDRTPEGAYMRIARSVRADEPAGFFAYLEQDAQWACYTVRDMRAKARARVDRSYPEPQRSQLLAQYDAYAKAPDGQDVFAIYYRDRKWSNRLRRDISGAANVEMAGVRATIVTVRGTRWTFRKRPNGIWGITIYTAELLAESEKATRDLAVVDAAADDYDRVKAAKSN